MDWLDYLDPVELEKPEDYYLHNKETISKKIKIHTESTEIGDIGQYNLALIGVPEDRNSLNKSTSLAPNKIRSELYKLISPARKTSIIDLGNIKAGNTYTDTYFALKEICYKLLCNNINIIIIGGSQDLTLGAFQALENYQDKINLAVIDYVIDSRKDALDSNADSYLFELMLKKKKLSRLAHLGHQTYLTTQENITLLNKLYFDAIRLGEVRADIKKIEPILRDCDLISFDIGCIRQSDAPGHFRPTPNGFYAEESCLIARYAGVADKARIFGLFEVNTKLDRNNQTAALAAEIIWHYLDGLEIRVVESPSDENNNFKTFIVTNSDLDEDMVFYKSMNTERWWMKIPGSNIDTPSVIACSEDDYKIACNHEIPSSWWKNFQRLI